MRPPIGFDRDIKLEWLDAVATQVSASRSTEEVRQSIHKMLTGVLASGKAGSALTKTTTVLLRIWSRVPEPAVGLRDRIAQVIPELSTSDRVAAHWSMCLATYPFFLDVAATIGRLLALQDEVSLIDLRRRLAERWGDRSLMPQASGKVVRSMVSWGVLRNVKPGLYRSPDRHLHVSSRAETFLVEAILIGSDNKSLPISNIDRHPGFFPFQMAASVSVLRAAKQFSVHRQGVDMEIVELAVG
jgi:hypothetical protein